MLTLYQLLDVAVLVFDNVKEIFSTNLESPLDLASAKFANLNSL